MASHKSATPPVVRHCGHPHAKTGKVRERIPSLNPTGGHKPHSKSSSDCLADGEQSGNGQLDKTAKHSHYQQQDEGGEQSDLRQSDELSEQSDLRQSAELSEQSDYQQSDEAQNVHHPTSTAHREAARGTAGESKAAEGKKRSRWRCPLHMGSFSSAIVGGLVGGLVVFGLSFNTPWINYSDPAYKVDPPRDMHINEELDKTTSNLMNDLEARFRDATVDIRKYVEMDIQREVGNRHESVTQHADMRIEEAVGNVKDSLNTLLETRIQETLWEQKDTLEKMAQKVCLDECSVANAVRRWKTRLIHNHKIHLSSWDHLRKHTLEKFEDIQLSQELVYDVIKGMGFMRSGSWGVLTILMGVMEIILFVCICVFFKNRRASDVSPAVQVAPAPQVDSGDRNTLCIVCFVDRDVAQIQRWTEEIVRETRASQRMRTLTHVIASRGDIQSVPTCRLALVFVNPDDRQLILEDEYHMDSSRRDTVEAVRRKGGEVILIAYSDPTSRIPVLTEGQLFDPSLTEVTSHPVLRDLNSNRRVLSVKESFSEYQKRHLIDSIDQIFT